jgi:hypothetical protein
MSENPNIVHGRLLEAAHISGYTFERACSELEHLLEGDRWRELGFDSGNAFAESIKSVFASFRISLEQRKPLSKKLTAIASQRAVAGVLGVDVATVNRDVADATPTLADSAESGQESESDVADATPAWFQRDSDPSKLAKRHERLDKKLVKQRALAGELNARNADLPADGRKYQTIYADPPWQFQTRSEKGKMVVPDNSWPVIASVLHSVGA